MTFRCQSAVKTEHINLNKIQNMWYDALKILVIIKIIKLEYIIILIRQQVHE
jgi:hypothetical protein